MRREVGLNGGEAITLGKTEMELPPFLTFNMFSEWDRKVDVYNDCCYSSVLLSGLFSLL